MPMACPELLAEGTQRGTNRLLHGLGTAIPPVKRDTKSDYAQLILNLTIMLIQGSVLTCIQCQKWLAFPACTVSRVLAQACL